MTYKELKDKTTPGPFTRQCCTVLAKTGWVGDRDPWTLGASEEFHVCSTDENHRSHDEQEANAKLIVHCCNHFDALLAALRELLNEAEPRFDIIDMTDDEERAIEEAHAALAAAQEVK